MKKFLYMVALLPLLAYAQPQIMKNGAKTSDFYAFTGSLITVHDTMKWAVEPNLYTFGTLANATGYLKNDGSGNLSWVTVSGSGTVTSVGTGTALTGGPITGSGTINADTTFDATISKSGFLWYSDWNAFNNGALRAQTWISDSGNVAFTNKANTFTNNSGNTFKDTSAFAPPVNAFAYGSSAAVQGNNYSTGVGVEGYSAGGYGVEGQQAGGSYPRYGVYAQGCSYTSDTARMGAAEIINNIESGSSIVAGTHSAAFGYHDSVNGGSYSMIGGYNNASTGNYNFIFGANLRNNQTSTMSLGYADQLDTLAIAASFVVANIPIIAYNGDQAEGQYSNVGEFRSLSHQQKDSVSYGLFSHKTQANVAGTANLYLEKNRGWSTSAGGYTGSRYYDFLETDTSDNVYINNSRSGTEFPWGNWELVNGSFGIGTTPDSAITTSSTQGLHVGQGLLVGASTQLNKNLTVGSSGTNDTTTDYVGLGYFNMARTTTQFLKYTPSSGRNSFLSTGNLFALGTTDLQDTKILRDSLVYLDLTGAGLSIWEPNNATTAIILDTTGQSAFGATSISANSMMEIENSPNLTNILKILSGTAVTKGLIDSSVNVWFNGRMVLGSQTSYATYPLTVVNSGNLTGLINIISSTAVNRIIADSSADIGIDTASSVSYMLAMKNTLNRPYLIWTTDATGFPEFYADSAGDTYQRKNSYIGGLINSYNGITPVGYTFPVEVYKQDSSGVTAKTTSAISMISPSNATHHWACFVPITCTTGGASSTWTVKLGYTDVSAVTYTWPTVATTAAGGYALPVYSFRTSNNTAITATVTVTGTAPVVNYSIYLTELD